MANFQNSAITDSGRLLLADVQAGGEFDATRIVIGSGFIPAGKTAQTMTSVVAAVASLEINKKDRTNDGKVIFGGYFSNQDITTSFYFRELALYARAIYRNDDGSIARVGDEVLYSYGNAGSNADNIPAYSTNTVVERQIDIVSWVGNETTVNLTIENGSFIPVKEKGAPGGVATLDGGGKLAQMPSAADVGALALTGGELSGNLSIKKNAYAGMTVVDTTNGTFGHVQSDSNYMRVALFNDISSKDGRGLYIYNSKAQADLSDALKLVDIVDGHFTPYTILHTGNKDMISAKDVGSVPQVATYYPASQDVSVDDLIDPFALIPVSSTVNKDLYAAVGGTFAYVLTMFYTGASTSNRRFQLAFSYNSVPHRMAFRIFSANGWEAWKTVSTSDHKHTADDVGAVPTSRTVNGKALTGNIALSASDVGARPSTWTPSASDVGAVAKSGDTMSDDLKVEKLSYPSVRLIHPATAEDKSGGVFQQGANQTTISNFNVAGDSSNYRLLSVNNSKLYGVERALCLTDRVNGSSTAYNVLHTGNVTAGTTDLTAGSSALATGSIYQVYE